MNIDEIGTTQVLLLGSFWHKCVFENVSVDLFAPPIIDAPKKKDRWVCNETTRTRTRTRTTTTRRRRPAGRRETL